jgi:membrane protein DedA with SNARE-associated domain/pimeloyl-ACP methyl ester carboxylesterase
MLGLLLSYFAIYHAVALFVITALAEFGVPLPSAPLLIAAGAVASHEGIVLLPMVLAATGGYVVADIIVFLVARRYGVAFFERLGLRRVLASSTFRLVEREIDVHSPLVVLLSRLEVLASLSANIVGGISKMPLRKFLVADVVGQLAQSIVYIGIGYYFGVNWRGIYSAFGWEAILILALIVVLVAVYVRNMMHHALHMTVKKRPTVETRTYKSRIGPVDVICRSFFPEEHRKEAEDHSREAVVLIPGYGTRADSHSLVEVGKACAHVRRRITYVVSAWAERPGMPDALVEQARILARFISEKELRSIWLIGLSEGGDKAMYVADILEREHPGLTLKALILVATAGLYDRADPQALLADFRRDSAATTREAFSQFVHKGDVRYLWKVIAAGFVILASLIHEYVKSPSAYRKRTANDFRNIGPKNPCAATIRAPIVLVEGLRDQVIEVRKILPHVFVSDRAAFLRKELFRSSKYVGVLTPYKDAHHGFLYYRPHAICHEIFSLLDRNTGRKPRRV